MFLWYADGGQPRFHRAPQIMRRRRVYLPAFRPALFGQPSSKAPHDLSKAIRPNMAAPLGSRWQQKLLVQRNEREQMQDRFTRERRQRQEMISTVLGARSWNDPSSALAAVDVFQFRAAESGQFARARGQE